MATRQQKADDDARFQSHCGSMFMAQILRFIGGLPVRDQHPFLAGMVSTLGRWQSGELDRRATGWPAPMKEPAAAKKRTRRKEG